MALLRPFQKKGQAAKNPSFAQRFSGADAQWIFAFGVLLLGMGTITISAVAATANPATVSLGSVAGLPNSRVMVPLYFTPSSSETQVVRLTATVRFEKAAVSFLKAEEGLVLQSVKGTFEAQVEDDPEDAKQLLLRLEVSTTGGERFREGILLYLTFNIKPEATAETKVMLNWQDPEVSDAATSGGKAEPLEAKAGMIEVIPPEREPWTSCFFFTH